MTDGPGAAGVAAVLLAARRWILFAAIGVAVVACGITLLRPRTWTVEVSFLPESRSPATGLAGLAEQFGVAGLPGESGNSPEFYADLVRSRQILTELAAKPVPTVDRTGDVPGQTIAAALGANGADSARQAEDALRRLRRAVGAVAQSRTGLVQVRVTTRDPALSRDIADQLLTLVDTYNAERRQSRAGAERRFAEQRLVEAKATLAEAEGRLESFVVGNRRYTMDPQLLFRFERLSREVALRQQVVVGLASAYEQARMDEVRDTPVLSRVQQPYLPAHPDRRGLGRLAVLSLLIGGGLGALGALVRAAWRRALAADPAAATAVAAQLAQARAALGQWRPGHGG